MNTPSTALRDITEALKQPDIEQAVRQLYENYFEDIVVQICINGGSRDDGADIFQEAVLVLIDKVKSGNFRGDSSVRTFLSAIARNLWLHELRTRSRRSQREAIYMNNEETGALPADQRANGGLSGNISKLLEQVGDVCKKLLTGFYYEGKSMKQLLPEFNFENEQVLRNRKSRCMKKIKELLLTDTRLLNHLKSAVFYEQ